MPNEHDPGDPLLKEIPPQRASALSRCALCNKTFDDVETHSCASLRACEDPLIGTTIGGHYEIQQCLGRGGMSIVYKAKDVLIGRFVAVKLLLLQSGINAKALLRFQQEARAAAQLDHPNIIKVYEFNVPENASPYLILDYVEGPSIAEVLEVQHRIDQKRALQILVTVCEALEHAHSKGVVHRDLKPSNIMLAQAKHSQEVVKIVDFGIAKLHEFEGAQNQLTKSGEIFGSPLYMSPEQCSGEPVTKASDIYSLGCVMYEMLTSRPPFVGNNALETMLMQKSEAPKKMSESRPSLENADRLDLIVLKALAKSPKDRFASMKEMKEALLDVLERKQGNNWFDNLGNRLDTARARNAAGQRRSKPAVLLVGILLLALAGALALNVMTAEHKTKSAPPPAAIEEVKGDFLTLYKQAQGLMDRNNFADAARIASECYKMSGGNPRSIDGLAAAKLMADIKYVSHSQEYREWRAIVFSRHKEVETDSLQAVEQLRLKLQKATDSDSDRVNKEKARVLCSEAVTLSNGLLEKNAYSFALNLLDSARLLAEQSLPDDAHLMASILTNQGVALAHLERAPEGEALILKAIRLLESAPEENSVQIRNCKLSLCTLYATVRQARKAADTLHELVLTAGELRQDNPEVAEIYQKIARIELTFKAPQKAYQHYNLALSINEKQSNSNNLQKAQIELGLGHCCKFLNKPAEALQHALKALDLFEGIPMASDGDLRATIVLAGCNEHLPPELSRLALFKRALAIGFRSQPSYSHATELRDIGLWYKKGHDWASAINYLKSAAKMLCELPSHVKDNTYALILADLAACYEHQGDLKESASNYQQALECWKRQDSDQDMRLRVERSLSAVTERMTRNNSDSDESSPRKN
jgi:serine/threonine-protein kinase